MAVASLHSGRCRVTWPGLLAPSPTHKTMAFDDDAQIAGGPVASSGTATNLRASNPAVRNPLLTLPAATALAELSLAERAELGALLSDVVEQARGLALWCWRRRSHLAAVYWKTVAVYAGHIRALLGLTGQAPPKMARDRVAAGETARARLSGSSRHRQAANLLLELPIAAEFRNLSPATCQALRALLLELSRDAAHRSQENWDKHKAPLGWYRWMIAVRTRQMAIALAVWPRHCVVPLFDLEPARHPR